MTQLISLNKSAAKADVDGRRGEVLSALKKLGASSKEVALDTLKKTLKKMDPKVLRMHVRDLKEEKLVSVKKQKAEKAA